MAVNRDPQGRDVMAQLKAAIALKQSTKSK
jgi:hypothetical protein